MSENFKNINDFKNMLNEQSKKLSKDEMIKIFTQNIESVKFPYDIKKYKTYYEVKNNTLSKEEGVYGLYVNKDYTLLTFGEYIVLHDLCEEKYKEIKDKFNLW